MRIIKTDDKNYPIMLDDTFGTGCYIHKNIVTNDENWNDFIKKLNKIREEIAAAGLNRI